MAVSVSTVNDVPAAPRERGIENVGRHSDQQEQRIEPVPREDFPHQRYPRWIGHKFEPDGCLLPFPGHTIICHLPQNSSLYHELLSLHDKLRRQDFASCYVLLPPSSWHMTVYEGVSDQIRKRKCWPGESALDATLESCTTLVREKLASFDLGSEPPFRMTIAGCEPLEDGIALKVVPANLDEERRLRGLRDRLSKLLLMRHPGHDTYSFHVSLAYMLRFLGQKDHEAISAYLQNHLDKLPKVFELEAPEFCIFDDLFAFQRELY